MQGEQDKQDVSPYDSYIFENEQVEPDMSPLTRHDFSTLATALKLQCDNKIEQLKKQTIFFDERMNEEMNGTHKLINSNDQDNKTNFRAIDILINSLIQKDKDTKSRQENLDKKIKDAQSYLGDLALNQTHDNTRANNLEMKLRKKGYLSKQHAIDYVPYIKLPDKHKTGAPPPYDPYLANSLSHRTSTTIANKYTVL